MCKKCEKYQEIFMKISLMLQNSCCGRFDKIQKTLNEIFTKDKEENEQLGFRDIKKIEK